MGNFNIETDGIYNYGENEYYLSFQNGTRNWRAMHDKHLEDTKIELEEELEKAKKEIQNEILSAKTEIKSDISSAKSSINNNVDQVETKVDTLNATVNDVETSVNDIKTKVGSDTDPTSANTIFGKLNRLLDRWI